MLVQLESEVCRDKLHYTFQRRPTYIYKTVHRHTATNNIKVFCQYLVLGMTENISYVDA